MRWEGENCHAVFLTAIECNDWQMWIMTLQRRPTGRSLEGFPWEKSFTNFTNYSAFIQPGWLPSPWIPAGAPFKNGHEISPWGNRTWRHSVSCLWNVQGWSCQFSRFSGHQSPCLFATTARNNYVRYLHRFIPVSSTFLMSPEPGRRRPNTSLIFIK
jgi:hypothetical protein